MPVKEELPFLGAFHKASMMSGSTIPNETITEEQALKAISFLTHLVYDSYLSYSHSCCCEKYQDKTQYSKRGVHLAYNSTFQSLEMRQFQEQREKNMHA